MSVWQSRGFQLKTRLNLGYDLIDMNGCVSWTQLPDVIQKQRPDLPRDVIQSAADAWHCAMYNQFEGTAEYGRQSKNKTRRPEVTA